jgi:hypothetical protein
MHARVTWRSFFGITPNRVPLTIMTILLGIVWLQAMG